MIKTSAIISFILLINISVSAQPDLRIEPRNVVFKDIFNRIGFADIINRGDQPLSLDSLVSQNQFYIVNFENGLVTPFLIQPNDTIRMSILLSNFYNITVNDTVDTLWFYSNDPSGPRDLRIKIDFFDDDDRGTCAGVITDEQLQPLADVKIYFLYWGIYIIDSTSTDNNGNYSSLLPKGSYTVAAEKEQYQTIFYGNTPDPFLAYPVDLDSGQTVNLNLEMPFIGNTGFRISGSLIDSSGNVLVNKGVVVIRKGTHTPTLLKGNAAPVDSSIFAGFVKSDGSYSVTVSDSSYYFIQGFSDYYLPSFYNDEGTPALLWQEADSVYINQIVQNKNIVLKRDSAYGGGNAFGNLVNSFLESGDYDGISVFAKSIDNGALYAYNFVKSDGNFRVSNLPYGTYQLIAHKIGYPVSTSESFVIDSLHPDVSNISIIFNTSSTGDDFLTPDNFILYQNYPNPFNPSTKISWQSPVSSHHTLKIYDVLGNEIATLVNEFKSAGTYEIEFNAKETRKGISLPTGIYFYRLQAGNFAQTKKMILIK